MPYCKHFNDTLTGAGFRSEQGSKRFHCSHCEFVLYDVPKPCTNAIVVDGTRVLFGRRQPGGVEPGKWDIPGGFVELGESAEDATKREVREETGLEIELTGLLGVFHDHYDQWTTDTLSIIYFARPVGGTLGASDDLVEVRWFERDALPEDMAFQSNRDALNAWLATLGLPPRY